MLLPRRLLRVRKAALLHGFQQCGPAGVCVCACVRVSVSGLCMSPGSSLSASFA